jgi:hypothetical protein
VFYDAEDPEVLLGGGTILGRAPDWPSFTVS